MDLSDIETYLKGIPFMRIEQAKILEEIITTNKYSNVLELGFNHGVSTCYIANILSRISPDGKITTIDREQIKIKKPNIEELLAGLKLAQFVNVYYEPKTYLWRLGKFLEENLHETFDLCYIDGAHSWETDGFAFFLVDKLLKPGGTIIFDDLNWSYANSRSYKNKKLDISEEERTTPQIKMVFDLLVKTNSNYEDFEIINDWAIAKKKCNK